MKDKLFIQDGETKREFTPEEYAQHELDKAEHLRLANEDLAKQTAKAALLTRLNITEEEVKLLLL